MSNQEPGTGISIDIRNATKRYEKSVAVDDVSLSIKPGEFITLLGPSGSGKTTTLNLIAGFTDLSSGSIEIDGRRVDNVPAHKRGLGVVFQHYALFPHMNVAENIAFPLRQRKIPKEAQARMIGEILETVGLAGYQDRYPKELSGGQQQRVAFARAMVFDPMALLMDEPLGALDKNLREKLQLEIKRIHQEVGRTFVFVTHDQEEALILSDRIAIFNNGRIEQVGTSSDLYERPESLFVARFMGESTVFKSAVSSNGTDWSMDFHGTMLHGAARGGTPSSGALVLRPEQMRVAESESEVPLGSTMVPVKIIQNIYLGSGHKYELLLPDGTTGIVRTPRERGTSLRPGDNAWVHWNAEHGVLLNDHDLVSTT